MRLAHILYKHTLHPFSLRVSLEVSLSLSAGQSELFTDASRELGVPHIHKLTSRMKSWMKS